MLGDHYGFQVKLVRDATRYDILSALNEMRAKLTDEDNLLIYYAGHGELDKVNMRGHWLPVDAERDSTANWISNVAITDILNAMNARHILVVSDSCYSGSLTRARRWRASTRRCSNDETRGMAACDGLRSAVRTALTSGGLEPVLDAGGGEPFGLCRAPSSTCSHRTTTCSRDSGSSRSSRRASPTPPSLPASSSCRNTRRSSTPATKRATSSRARAPGRVGVPAGFPPIRPRGGSPGGAGAMNASSPLRVDTATRPLDT